MQNVQGFAVKGRRFAVVEDIAVRPEQVRRVPATRARVMEPQVRMHDVFTPPHRLIDPGIRLSDIIPDPPLRRAELTVPAALTATPADTDVFEGADGSKYVLPRYALAFDRVGLSDEPRIAVADHNGTSTLVLTLNETPSPAAGEGTSEFPRVVLAVKLQYRIRSDSGGVMVKTIPFPSALLDPATETVLTAELPLTPGQLQPVLAALSSLEANATLIVERGITVGVPTGEQLPDGAPGYRVRNLLLEWTVSQEPIVLSEAQRDRLGGGSGGVQQLRRLRIPYGGANYSYWQDPAWPDIFYFLPDRFLLARAEEGNRRPLLHVGAAETTGDETPRITFGFQALPVIDPDRLDAAQAQLEAAAREFKGTGALALEIMPDPQPLLRLALPQNGAPSAAMTERPGADIDLETGLVHTEVMGVNDFKLVYEALLGASLTMLRGEIRAAMSGSDPEDVPLELRIDKTVGDVLNVSPGTATAEGLGYRLENAIESAVRIETLAATAVVGDKHLPLRIDQLAAGQRLAPGEHVDILLVAPEPIPPPGPDAILFDQSHVAVEADAQAIWQLAFDRNAATPMTKTVTVEAFAPLFSSPDRPNDRVAAFVVTIERGGTVRLTETEPKGTTTVNLPLEPFLDPKIPMPPIRYKTETWWGSGGVGVSPWREVDGTILVPVKTAPN